MNGYPFPNESESQLMNESESETTTVPTCGMCQRQRTIGDPAHPMDSYGYTPMQVVTGQPFGWYSGDDGEMCPECMTKTMRGGL